MSTQAVRHGHDAGREAAKFRPVRADAPRNSDALLEAAAPGEAPARWFQRYTGVRATPPAMRKFAR